MAVGLNLDVRGIRTDMDQRLLIGHARIGEAVVTDSQIPRMAIDLDGARDLIRAAISEGVAFDLHMMRAAFGMAMIADH